MLEGGVSRAWFTLAAAAFLATAANAAFWGRLLEVVPINSWTSAAFLASVAVALVALFNTALTLVSFRRLLKPTAAGLLLVSALTGYFMSEYGLVIDRELIQSAAETDLREVADLLALRFFAWVIVLGVVPAVVVARVPVRFGTAREELARRAVAIGICLAIAAALVAVQFRQFVYVGREHTHLRQMINPLGPLQAAVRYAATRVRAPRELERVGLDAHRHDVTPPRSRYQLVILVVGETARAANFSLNGYERQTNPLLSELPVISFTQVRSCGTATSTSLPCMFSSAGRAAFDAGEADEREGLLDVLQRAGVAVLWRENNSGCKGTCDRVPTEPRKMLASDELCEGTECFDEVLLRGLQERIDALRGDALIVLHQQGSHGPAYYKRSPDSHKRFLPVCQGGSLQSCSRESIINAYDNSIVYTDWLLAGVIELLHKNAERFDTAMLYVSDHGESLGERGLYLHGMPWLVAPDEQTRVPMILWVSDSSAASLSIDIGCLARRRSEPLSHDEVFHSMLGLFDVWTDVYRAERDLFATCRPLRSRDRCDQRSGTAAHTCAIAAAGPIRAASSGVKIVSDYSTQCHAAP